METVGTHTHCHHWNSLDRILNTIQWFNQAIVQNWLSPVLSCVVVVKLWSSNCWRLEPQSTSVTSILSSFSWSQWLRKSHVPLPRCITQWHSVISHNKQNNEIIEHLMLTGDTSCFWSLSSSQGSVQHSVRDTVTGIYWCQYCVTISSMLLITYLTGDELFNKVDILMLKWLSICL